MKKRTRSLLEEINLISPVKDKTQLLESRGINALNSIINLLEMIETSFDEATAADLQKRLLLSIKNRDSDRFVRGIKKVRDDK
tara:strand:- start:2751 stop:2999 length:249 start_codon:yes stop_codon:yes gene_type:complete